MRHTLGLTALSALGMALLLGAIGQTEGAVVAHWRLEGTQSANIVSDTDVVGGFVGAGVQKTPKTVQYGSPVPGFGGASSADFNNSGTSNNNGAYLIVPDADALTGHPGGFSQLTLEASIRPDEIKQSVIARKFDNATSSPNVNDDGYWLDLRSDGKVTFHVGQSGTVFTEVDTGAGSIQTGNWYRVAGVWDGSTAKIFLDGTQIGPGASYTGVLNNTEGALGIGGLVRHNNGSNTGQFFNGLIDEVRISDVALSPNQFLKPPAASGVVTFQEGVDGYAGTRDTTLFENAPDLNWGSTDRFEVGHTGSVANNQRHSLLGFDVTSLDGQFQSIDSATLHLYKTTDNDDGSTTRTLGVYAIASANGDWQEDQATWNYKVPTTQAWAGLPGLEMPTTDFDPILLDTVDLPGEGQAGWVSLSLPTSLVTDWVAGNNNGLMLVLTSTDPSGFHRADLASSEWATVTQRPMLEIQFTVPEPCSVLVWATVLLGLGVFGRRGRT